jgi:hypothetical protein
LYWDEDDEALLRWDGDSWVEVGGTGAGGSDDQTAAEVPFTPAGTIAATDVQAAIEEVASEAATNLSNHTGDAADAHDASAISVADAATVFTATEVEAALLELYKRPVEVVIQVSDPNGAAITTGDGKAYFPIPALLNGANLTAANASLTTVSSSGDPLIQIHNLTQTADMLSTRITIQANELHSKDGTPGVVDANNDDVATGDLIRVDVDTAGTGAKGLSIILRFQLP